MNRAKIVFVKVAEICTKRPKDIPNYVKNAELIYFQRLFSP